jgi:hypothetical protein
VVCPLLAQFPPRLLLTGAVVTALTASAGTVLTFPTATLVPQLQPGPQSTEPASPVGPAVAAPATPPAADGAQIAGLAAGPVPGATRAPRPVRTPAPTPPAPVGDAARPGLTESDWERLPVGLRDSVREACGQGYLSGAHCTHA